MENCGNIVVLTLISKNWMIWWNGYCLMSIREKCMKQRLIDCIRNCGGV